MKLKTGIEFPDTAPSLDHDMSALLLGSCFAERIGERMKSAKMRVVQNPLGIQFNPYSLAKIVRKAIRHEQFSSDSMLQREDLYYHWDLPASQSKIELKEFLKTSNEALELISDSISNFDVLIVSFGTAWVYELMHNAQVVANCHKQEAHLFIKRMLSFEEIVQDWKGLLNEIQKLNPSCRIIFTISPVRHIKNGLVDDRRSKSLLNLAVHELKKAFSNQVSYFPAYEILIDELRDYRFYESDLIHPNELAVDIIWKYFVATFFRAGSKETMDFFEGLSKKIRHKSLWPDSKMHKKFILKVLDEIKLAKLKFPYVDLSPETKLLTYAKQDD